MRDKRGVLRGRCSSCKDCDDYEVTEGKTACAYCGCAPACHLNMSPAATTSIDAAQASSSASSSAFHKMSEERKERLGWVSYPKEAKTRFTNALLPEFYSTYWVTCQDQKIFKREFLVERNRQFGIREKTDKCLKTVNFVQSMNSAGGGRFLSDTFRIKSESDGNTIKLNREKLGEAQKVVSEMTTKLEEHNNTLFKSGTSQLRQGRGTMYSFNTEYLAKLKELDGTIASTDTRLQAALAKVERIHPTKRRATARKSRMEKQQRRKKTKRQERRKEKAIQEILQAIAPNGSSPVQAEEVSEEAVKNLSYKRIPSLHYLLETDLLTAAAKKKTRSNLTKSCRDNLERMWRKSARQADMEGGSGQEESGQEESGQEESGQEESGQEQGSPQKMRSGEGRSGGNIHPSTVEKLSSFAYVGNK
ncbi:uncharacterized protein [Branchiostoma lanceolatum]|uniref:uncharacterized protein n=1 Tax=Branchiostoma lanceolatum TaxID=7740 RepID=UPI003454B15B